MTFQLDRAPTRAREVSRWWSVCWRGTAVWLVPFFGTTPLVRPDGSAAVPMGVFKLVAVGWLLVVLLAVRRWSAPAWRPSRAAAVYVLISVVFDLLVLVGQFRMPVVTWAMTVLPAYLLVPVVMLARTRSTTSRGAR